MQGAQLPDPYRLQAQEEAEVHYYRPWFVLGTVPRSWRMFFQNLFMCRLVLAVQKSIALDVW